MGTIETLRRIASALLPDVYLLDAVRDDTNPARARAQRSFGSSSSSQHG